MVDWQSLDPASLFADIRAHWPGPDAEKSVWAFERALEAARVDGDLLEHLVMAAVALVAHGRAETPRTVLEAFFRRSVSDHQWRSRYAPLFEQSAADAA